MLPGGPGRRVNRERMVDTPSPASSQALRRSRIFAWNDWDFASVVK